MIIIRVIIFAFMILIPLQAAHCREDLLSFLIEQNEAAREKIKTAKYRVKWTQDVETKDEPRHNGGFGEVKIKGDWRFSIHENNVSIPTTGFKQKQTPRMVINDKYLAYWPEIGNAYIYQYDHQSLKELSDDSKIHFNLFSTPDRYSFNFAFGGEKETTFKEMMKLHPDETKWSAEEATQSNGDIIYLIKRYSRFMNDPAIPDAVWTIDPQKGFLVTQAVFYSKAGNVWVTRKIEPKEIGSGVWIPAFYQELCYGKPTDPKAREKPDRNNIVQLEDVSINNEISDDYFAIESILPKEYRESTTLFHKGLDGNTQAYVYKYGRYVLREHQNDIEYLAQSLMGKALPDLKDLGIDLSTADVSDKMILICFFDMEQRPSRNCILQLSKKARELKEKDVIVVAVQTSNIEQSKLDEWIKENEIIFPVGMIEDDEEKKRSAWAVVALAD
jgi:hypothetical protein